MQSMTQLLATVGRWVATALFCVSAIAFVWQVPLPANPSANAAPAPLVMATTNAGDKIQRENKSFVKNAAEKVKETANKNASRVEDATDNNGSVIERKAQRDAARIEDKANKDAARTQRAIDKNVNAVERTVDNIKDAFSK